MTHGYVGYVLCGVLILVCASIMLKPVDNREEPGSNEHAAPPTEWEHGWKTQNVTATRYKSDFLGYNIGFQVSTKYFAIFDRAEVFDFLEGNGGIVYSGGGYPGAEIFVIFRDVKDKESAATKLKDLLPKFEELLVTL